MNKPWIWLDPEQYPEQQRLRISCFDKNQYSHGMAVFRREFELESPAGVRGEFSGDCKFRLKINGSWVCDGPPEVGGDYANTTPPDWWFYDSMDLTEYLRPGSNTIEAEVLLNCDAQTDYSTGQGGFYLELFGAAGQPILQTGGDWDAYWSPAWQPGHYDATLEPEPPAWSKAVPVPNPPWKPETLGLPPLEITEIRPDIELPLTVEPGVPKVIRLKFERKLTAHFEMMLDGAAGATVLIEYGELPDYYHYRETYRLKDGRQCYRSTRMNVFTEIRLTVQCGSFNFPSYEPVTLEKISVFNRNFPVRLMPLATSDPELDAVRDCCAATLKTCMQRLHLDSPQHQEGLGCTGDYMIEALMGYYLFGEARLAAADIRRTAYLLRQKNGVMFHTSYSLMWIMMLRDYYYHSGDLELVREVFPQVEGLLELFASYVGAEGLVSQAPTYMFVDWVNDPPYNYHHPPAERGMGAMTAWYYQALNNAAELAERCGMAHGYTARAAAVKTAFRRLWDGEKQFYRDGISFINGKKDRFLPPDSGQASYTMHTNILALAYGLADDETLLDRVMNHNWPIRPQPYFYHFIFEALWRHGAFGRYGGELLELWYPLVREHSAGLKECWNCGDYCHAWGGTPAYQLGRSIMGIAPSKPGFEEVLIDPNPLHLKYFHGELNTPRGLIRIEFERNQFHITLPPEMRYRLQTNLPVEIKQSN